MSPTTKPGRKRQPIECAACNGTGEVIDRRDERGRPVTKSCGQCGGKGER